VYVFVRLIREQLSVSSCIVLQTQIEAAVAFVIYHINTTQTNCRHSTCWFI